MRSNITPNAAGSGSPLRPQPCGKGQDSSCHADIWVLILALSMAPVAGLQGPPGVALPSHLFTIALSLRA